jgi:hypothetical protein
MPIRRRSCASAESHGHGAFPAPEQFGTRTNPVLPQHLYGRHRDVLQNGLVREQIVLLEDHSNLVTEGDHVEVLRRHLDVADLDEALINRRASVTAGERRSTPTWTANGSLPISSNSGRWIGGRGSG